MSTVSNAKSLLTEIKFHHRSYYYILSLSLSLDDALLDHEFYFLTSGLRKRKKKKKKKKDDDVIPAIYSYNFILLFLANKKNTLPPGNK